MIVHELQSVILLEGIVESAQIEFSINKLHNSVTIIDLSTFLPCSLKVRIRLVSVDTFLIFTMMTPLLEIWAFWHWTLLFNHGTYLGFII